MHEMDIPDLDREARQISQRLSLRPPQADSLALLADIIERVGGVQALKTADPAEMLAAVREAYPHVEDFERDFPSLTFALATGVGKTRLMGAFVAYLYETKASRHFLVLAPNLTIYDKLIKDFTPGTAKYVFKGLPIFATQAPVLVTGDNYEDGRGVRAEGMLNIEADCVINVFNISKINADKDKRGIPRVRRLQEYIGESYFDYLAGLDDLVLLMDEAHRYRAAAGMKAINELNPVLGLELTATPKSTGARGQDFKNVLYGYSLGEAMQDGFVKEPAVVTRENFDPKSVDDEALERIKLQDGITYHEKVKAELEVYARQENTERVKPFVLVVAKDTTHAGEIETLIKSQDFFSGRYADKVIQIHSKLSGELKDESVQRLLQVESPLERTEIVIHVNKLGEGWDVTNLFTIVPLRASASEILTEQTIGRGLRLPYGRRTGVDMVDTLAIIAHDRFQAVVEAAKDQQSLIRKHFTIGENGDVSSVPVKPVHVPSTLETAFTGAQPGFKAGPQSPYTPPPPILETDRERTIAGAVFESLRVQASSDISGEQARKSLVEAAHRTITQSQEALPGLGDNPKVEDAEIRAIVDTLATHIATGTIEIPRVVVSPDGDINFGYNDFDLTDLNRINYSPLAENLIIEEVRTGKRREPIVADQPGVKEARSEDYIIRALLDYDEIDYDDHADLLQKLATQIVHRLSEYLDEVEVERVAYQYENDLAKFVAAQLAENRWESPVNYQAHVTAGIATLKPLDFTMPEGAPLKHHSEKPATRSALLQTAFGGFSRALYPVQKFDSDQERIFAGLLERDDQVQKWMKPARKQLQIEWDGRGANYEPDFVIETADEKWIVEVKAEGEMESPEVLAKMRAAVEWCSHASESAEASGGKPWVYLLIPHTSITTTVTLDALRSRYERKSAPAFSMAT